MVKFWSRNKKSNKPYSWDTSKGGSGISPTNASVESSTMVKQKDLDKEEKKREEMIKQEMKKRETIFYPSPFRGNSSGSPKINWNFVKAQEDASKVRAEIREGAMPMDTSKKVDEMMKNATIEREDEKEKVNDNQQWQNKFLGGGVYTPNVESEKKQSKDSNISSSQLLKELEKEESLLALEKKYGSEFIKNYVSRHPELKEAYMNIKEEKKDFVKAEEEQIEKERDNMKKQGVDKTATKEPYVSYGSSHPDRPQTLTDELKQLKNLGRWQRENIPSRVPEEMTDDNESGDAEVNDSGVYGMNIPIIDEKTKKQKIKIFNGIEVPQFAPAKLLVFNFRNKKGEEFQMPVYADSKEVGKHVKVFSIDGDKIPKSSGKGQKEFGDTTNIQSFNFSRVRETIAILTEKAGFEPVNWNLQNIKANQAGQIIRNLLEVSEIIDSKGKKL